MGAIQGVGEEDGVSRRSRLARLFLCDGLGAVEVVLDGNDGQRLSEDLRVRVGNPTMLTRVVGNFSKNAWEGH